MSIINSRPLTSVCQGDPTTLQPLTPNHILTMKSKVPPPPPGEFVREDMYLRKRWRRVQYLVEQFWSRWRKEYVAIISKRQKWLNPKRNIQEGDIVLVVDDKLHRNQWLLGIVVNVDTDKNNLVRHAKIKIGNRNLNDHGIPQTSTTFLQRSVHKLVLIQEALL